MNTNTHKKNRFLTFCFSCIPGAGQMYLGFLKRGTTLLMLFSGIIALAGSLNLEFLLFLIPVIWFYSFFDALNINGMPDEQYNKLSDELLFSGYTGIQEKFRLGSFSVPVAVTLIVIGASWLLRNMGDLFSSLQIRWIGYYVTRIANVFPQFALSVLLIWFGLHLIIHKKQELDETDEEDIEKGEPS